MGYVSSLSSNVSAYTPVTTSGEVSFTGLGNGTDFQEIIDVTINAEGFLLDEYKEQKTATESIVNLLEKLNKEIDDFNGKLDKMDEPDEFYSMKGTSNGDEVDIKVTGEADVGVHTVIVDQLAQNDVWVNTTQGYASEDTVIADTATTLQVEFKGETISIDIAGGTTLKGLTSTINGSVDSRDKFEADLMNDGENFYFVLKSADSGEANTIKVLDTGSLKDMATSDFTNTQTGQDARFRVDGFPADSSKWIERDTNSIDDVVDGITFELKEPTKGEALRIAVDYDTDAMKETITSFTESMNQIILDIQVLTGRVTQEKDSETETQTIDNYAMDIIYNDIKSILSSSAKGFSYYDETEGGDYYTALSQIGFSTDADDGSDTFGQLLLDEDKLEKALGKDPEAVAELFAVRAKGESDSDSFQVISVIDTVTPPGEHNVEYTVSGGALTSATINGQPATIEGWTILGTDSNSKGLYLSIADQGDGDFSGTARVKQGKLGQLSDSLDNVIDKDTGTLPILIENYEKSVTKLDKDIYNEEERLDTLKTSLTRKYATLDSMLSTYENKSSLLSSQIASLA